MRKCICSAVVLMLTAVIGQAGDAKIGVVDMSRLLDEFDQTKTMEALLEQQIAEVKKEMATLAGKYEKEKDALIQLQQEVDDKALSEERRDEKLEAARAQYGAVQELRQRMTKTREVRKMEISEQRMRMHRTIVSKLSTYVASFAKKAGYAMILDQSGMAMNAMPGVVYAIEEMDVTESVLEHIKEARKEQ